jgi:hypothetical protein
VGWRRTLHAGHSGAHAQRANPESRRCKLGIPGLRCWRSASRNDEREFVRRCDGKKGDRAMTDSNPSQRPDTPFPKHWLYYIAIKLALLAGAVALVLKLYGFW